MNQSLQTLSKLNQFLQNLRENIYRYNKNSKQALFVPLYHFQQVYDCSSFKYKLTNPKPIELNCMTLHTVIRILQIINICRNNLLSIQATKSKNKLITKRSLYYQLNQYYKEYATIDTDLKLICQSLQVARKDLGIIASNRCIIFGKITIFADGIKYRDKLDEADVITVPTCSELFLAQFQGRNIILIEKQSIFFEFASIFKQNNVTNFVMITAKGYPDQVTRSLLHSIMSKVENIFYFGDYDVFGFDIFLFYAFGDWSCGGLLQKIKLIQVKNYLNWFNTENLIKQFVTFDSRDLAKIQSIKKQKYFTNIDQMKSNELSKKIRKLRNYFFQFETKLMKAELQTFHKHSINQLWMLQLIKLSIKSEQQ